jgi:hypothetical protein
MPGALAPNPRPVDTDLLHFSHLLGQPPIPWGRGRPAPSLGNRPSGGRLRADPAVLGDCSPRDDMSRRLRGASPEGALVRWNLLRRALPRRCHRIGNICWRSRVRSSALTMNDAVGTREGRRRQKPGHTRHRAFPGWRPGAATTITAPRRGRQRRQFGAQHDNPLGLSRLAIEAPLNRHRTVPAAH